MQPKKVQPSRLKSIAPVLGVFLGVFVLRLLVLERLTASQFLLPESGDMHFYNEWALRILRGRGTEQTAFYGLPLYAYLLASIYKLFGYNPFIPGLLQAGLEGGTAVLISQLGARVFGGEGAGRRGQVIGLVAAAGWAFFQPAQAYSIILMPTVWLVLVFWFVVWEIVRRSALPALPICLLFGVLLGFTAMGIATILFLLPLVVAAFFLRWKAILSRRCASVALLFAGIFLGASPAWIHNYFVARDPVFLSAHSGVNFWIGNNPLANGYPKFPPGLRAGQEAMLQDSITTAERAAGRPLKRSEVSAFWSEKARAWIGNHPLAWVQLLGTKMKNFWNAFQYDDLSIITILREQGVIFPGLKFGFVAALALPGLLLAGITFPASRWISAAILLQMGSLLTVFVTERYRLAAVPGLLLGAAFTLWELWESSAHGRYRRATLCLVLLLGATWFVSIPQRDPGLWALDAYNSGWQALQVNDLPLARERLELAYSYVPENSEINFALGNLHLAERDRAGAKAFYAAALQLESQHEGALNNLGVLALEEQQWKAAIKLFSSALALTPADAKSHYLLARAKLGNGDKEGALAEVEIALRLEPDQQEFLQLREQIPRR